MSIGQKYKAYPEYKDSGVEWLGEISSGWKIKRFKRIFTIRKRIAGELGHDILSITQRGIKIKDTESGDGQLSMDYSKYQTVNPSDFAMNHMDLLTGYVDISKYAGVTSPDYRVFTIEDKECDKRYFLYLLQLCYIAKIFFPLGQGAAHIGRWRLPTEAFNEFRAPCPSLSEQAQIANFLDHETTSIDTLIEEQQVLIKLLQEKRQAVISHAVTKGLNPNAPMKDSGVEWLGDVPEHWGVSALGYYANLNAGATPDRSQARYWLGEIPWIKTGEVRYDTIYKTEECISEAALSESSVQISPPGTLLMAMYGQGVTRGRVAILGVPATYNQACVAISPNEKVSNEYLRFYFMAAYHAIRDGGNETSQMNLNADIVGKFKVTIPPKVEQADVVAFLEKELVQYDALIEETNSAVDLSKERRTALISAAVTGKIDVRDWQPPAQAAV